MNWVAEHYQAFMVGYSLCDRVGAEHEVAGFPCAAVHREQGPPGEPAVPVCDVAV